MHEPDVQWIESKMTQMGIDTELFNPRYVYAWLRFTYRTLPPEDTSDEELRRRFRAAIYSMSNTSNTFNENLAQSYGV